jgi:hypothetical protein
MGELVELWSDRRSDSLSPGQDIFGRFIGRWHIISTSFDQDSGEWTSSTAQWQFARILGGLGIQDILVDDDAVWGTTLRTWDEAGGWRVVWFCPRASEHCVLAVTEYAADHIRMAGTQADGRPIRWEFSDITMNHFSWDGWCSDDAGASWWHEQHMDGSR